MKFISVLIVFAFALTASADRALQIQNNCSYTIWPGLVNKANSLPPLNGGFQLDQNDSKIFQVPDDWFGAIWPRTNCDESGLCETGDCGGVIECNGTEPTEPVTVALFYLNFQGYDIYAVTLTDGYNVPVEIYTAEYTFQLKLFEDPDSCAAAGCHGDDLNAHCPDELAVRDSNETTIACKTACQAFGTDQYCCTGDYKNSCDPTQWPVNYAAIFKQYCPDAVSFEGDQTSAFNCTTSPQNNFVVQFCPSN